MTLTGVSLPAYGANWLPWGTAVDAAVRSLEAQQGGWTDLVLESDVNNSTTTGASTGLEIPSGLAAGIYEVDARILVVSADSACGVQMAWRGATGVTPALRFDVPSAPTTVVSQYMASSDAYTANTSGPTAMSVATITGVVLVSATTTTTMRPMFRSEVAGTQVTVKAGSKISWRRVSTTVIGGASTTPVNPAGTLIFSDLFTGADGSAWGSAWTLGYTGTNGAAATINGNRGKLTTGSGGSYAATDRITRRHTAQIADFHALFSFMYDASDTEAYLRLPFRCSTSTLDTQNGYELQLNMDGLRLLKVVGYAGTTIGSPVTRVHTKGQRWWCRVQAIGSAIKVKTWPDSTVEPGIWDIEVTDATYSAAGYWGFQLSGSSTPTQQSAYIEDVYVAQS